MKFTQAIPKIYRSFFEWAGLDFDLAEQKAQCDNCTMAQPQKPQKLDGESSLRIFKAHLKCCTFFPEVPNYIVGALLKESPMEITQRVEGFFKSDLTTKPLGLYPPASYREKYKSAAAAQPSLFGSLDELLCPFFVKESLQSCGIWDHRPSSCVRFVCQSSYGERGQQLWQAVESLLNLTEHTLAHEALLQLGFTQTEIESGEWYEFKKDKKLFYVACYEAIIKLEPEQIYEILQPEVTNQIDELKQIAEPLLSC